MSDQDDAPVQDEPIAEPVNEGAEAPELNEEPEPEQPQEEEAEPEEPSQPEEEQDYQPVDYSQYRNSNQQLPLNEDGSVDPLKFRDQLKDEIRQEMRFERQEERAWQAVERQYPQLKGDKDVREILLNQRIANAIQGKETNLTKIADRLYGRINTAKNEGRAQANISTKVQKAASLETATSNTGEGKSDQLLDRISQGDKTAANELLEQWLEAKRI